MKAILKLTTAAAALLGSVVLTGGAASAQNADTGGKSTSAERSDTGGNATNDETSNKGAMRDESANRSASATNDQSSNNESTQRSDTGRRIVVIGFDTRTGGYCDRWGCPTRFWTRPISYGPVFYQGSWFRGPVYTRLTNGTRWFWIHGGWHRDQWEGPRPRWARVYHFGPALGLNFYRQHGFRITARDIRNANEGSEGTEYRAYRAGYGEARDRNENQYRGNREENPGDQDQYQEPGPGDHDQYQGEPGPGDQDQYQGEPGPGEQVQYGGEQNRHRSDINRSDLDRYNDQDQYRREQTTYRGNENPDQMRDRNAQAPGDQSDQQNSNNQPGGQNSGANQSDEPGLQMQTGFDQDRNYYGQVETPPMEPSTGTENGPHNRQQNPGNTPDQDQSGPPQ